MGTPRRLNREMIELAGDDGQIAINQAHISYIKPTYVCTDIGRQPAGCLIRIINEHVHIKDQYQDILDLILEIGAYEPCSAKDLFSYLQSR